MSQEEPQVAAPTPLAAKTTAPRRRRKGAAAKARERAQKRAELCAPANNSEFNGPHLAGEAEDGQGQGGDAESNDAGSNDANGVDIKQANDARVLPLKRGDIVVTVPSPKFPKSVELEVLCLIPTGDDFAVHFVRNRFKAWLRNFGHTYLKKA